jgi:hypothetical protein
MDLQTKISEIKTLLAEQDYYGVPRRKARQVIANLRQSLRQTVSSQLS